MDNASSQRPQGGSTRSSGASPQRPQVVVITGASAGVGRATAQAFARRGAHIGLIARGEDGLAGAKRDVEAAGGQAVTYPVDVADPEQVEAAARKIEEDLGPIDIWINNAMASVFSPIKEMTAAEFQRVTAVTYLGCVYGTLAALRRMLPRDHGVVLQVGSALAFRAIPLQSAYCAAKHAVKGFTESLRTELLHDHSGVTVTIVQLPAVNTPQFDWVKSRLPHLAQPVPPIFQPEVIAEAIVRAAHDKRREVVIGWPAVQAIWGEKFIPGLLDRYLAKVGYNAQQTDQPAARDAPNNLWKPVPGDPGTHGRFDARARSYSAQVWMDKNRRWLIPLGGAALLCGVGAILTHRRGLKERR